MWISNTKMCFMKFLKQSLLVHTSVSQVHADVSCHVMKRNKASIHTTNRVHSEVDKAQTAKRDERTIFEKIIAKEIKADIMYEDDQCLAFKDVSPQAPVHFLVVPKVKVPMLNDATENHKELLGHLLLTSKNLAKDLIPKGYRIVINNGVEGCQSVYHLHIHILGGRQMKWPPG